LLKGKLWACLALLKGKLWALLAGVCGLIWGFEGFIGALYGGES